MKNNKQTPKRTTDAFNNLNNIKRLYYIYQYYQSNPGCTQDEAITFIPETKFMVEQYSKIL